MFALALAAVLAVATPATAGQLVLVDVEVSERGISQCPITFKPTIVDTGTQDFRDLLQAALFVAATIRESGCGIARVSVTPVH